MTWNGRFARLTTYAVVSPLLVIGGISYNHVLSAQIKDIMQRKIEGKKILFATIQFDGHFNPLTGLAKYLQSLGCDVRWYTGKLYREKLEKLSVRQYTFQRALNVHAFNKDEVFPERKLIKDPIENAEFILINSFQNRAVEYFEDISEIRQSFEFDLMIADCAFSGIPFVRAKLNVPVIAMGIVPLPLDSVDLAPYGMALLPPQNDAEREAYAQLRKKASDVFFKKSLDNFAVILDQHDIPNEKSFLFDLLIKQSDLYLQIGTPSFEYTRSDLSPNVRYIGALLPYDSGNAKTWFDERVNRYKKVILVSQGTLEFNMSKLLEPTLEAFTDTDVLVIAVTGIAKGTRYLREKFSAENLIIEDYIPFNAVMPYVNVFVTNGGYGSCLLAIKNHLPMVVAGLYEGKNEICARIGYFDLGINLNTELPTTLQLKAAIGELLINGMYKDNVVKLAEEMALYDSNALAVQYIEELLD